MNKPMNSFFVYLIAAIGGIFGGYILLLLLMILHILPMDIPHLSVIVVTYVLSWLLPFLLIRWWLVHAKVGTKKLGSGIFTAVLVIILIGFLLYMMGSPFRIIGPTRIIGGAPGNYEDGQIVWAIKKVFLGRAVKQGDVVLFNEPYPLQSNGTVVVPTELMGGAVAEVVGIPGEQMSVTVYDFMNNPMPSVIPVGYVAIEKNSSGTFRLLDQRLITDVVVWP